MIGLAFLTLVALWLGNNAYHFYKNWQKAKQLGVPIIFAPVGAFSPIWMVFQDLTLPFLEKLPFGLGEWTRYVKRDGNYIEKYALHERYGEIFAHVSPTIMTLYVADPLTADTLLQRKAGLDKPQGLIALMDVFGPSLPTVVGETWANHRKLTAPPFSESNCKIVWNETLRQTSQMLTYWSRDHPSGTRTIADDAMTLSLHVITCAGFGLTYEFESDKKGVPESSGKPTYRDCFADLLCSPALCVAMPSWLNEQWWMPARIGRFLKHRKALGEYMNEMLATGKQQAQRVLEKSGEEKPNILSTLILKSEQAKNGLFDDVVDVDNDGAAEKKLAPPSKRGLSDKEILGNLFMFGLAGHETTAHSISYATYLLASYPEFQDWLAEEIEAVLGKEIRPFESVEYEATFNKLFRVKALMYESLRMFPPVSALFRVTLSEPKPLPVTNSPSITVPPHTEIFPNVSALHSHPSWGADALSFKPSRFISTNETSTPTVSPFNEAFNSPPKGVPKGAFNAWADGPRACPGRKFAQVEFVGLIVGLLWGHRIEVVPEGEETVEQARERAREVTRDSTMGVTLGIREPERVKIRRVKV